MPDPSTSNPRKWVRALRRRLRVRKYPEYVIGKGWKARRQRAQRGWSDEDTFSFDNYLAGVIAGGVQRLRDRDLGTPGMLGPEDHDDQEGWEKAHRKWQEIQEQIVFGFSSYAAGKDWDNDDVDEALRLFHKYFGALWD